MIVIGDEHAVFGIREYRDRTYYTRDEFAEYNTLDPAGQAALTERLIEKRLKYLGYID